MIRFVRHLRSDGLPRVVYTLHCEDKGGIFRDVTSELGKVKYFLELEHEPAQIITSWGGI